LAFLTLGRRLLVAAVGILIAGGILSAWDRGAVADYRARRAQLVAATGDGVIILFGYSEADAAPSTSQFHQNEAFYYLTGWREPGAALMIVPKPPTPGEPSAVDKEVFYLPARNPAAERWTGPKLGPEAADASTRIGVDQVHRSGLLPSELLEALKTFPKIYTELTPQLESGEDQFVAESVAKLKMLAPLAELQDIRPLLQSMRGVKSPGEVALIRRAAEISIDGQLAVMKALRPGMWEYELGALMAYETARRGSEWVSYPPIVGSGFFSTVLHYNTNDRQMQDGDLVVIDAAGSYSGYASDITRTLPVNGRFSARQREIYEIVRGAQAAAIAAAKPGVLLRGNPSALYEIALNYINTHGKDQQGRPLGRYFIHQLGHSVGLNVHDPMDYDRALAPGVIVTIEPGIYIPDERLGVRIEDMILITASGNEVMTRRLPSGPDEIERVIRGR
jgi:Xaa-Pro aminopeptidase